MSSFAGWHWRTPCMACQSSSRRVVAHPWGTKLLVLLYSAVILFVVSPTEFNTVDQRRLECVRAARCVGALARLRHVCGAGMSCGTAVVFA